ncbi:MAG: F0F1 ATP synthase subunit gamma [Micavibrio aeruginosavorus]|uniref:ATP synthase gamma chain n=1 Tax=Micavibrio aeruginosavorus TaxID=349221 RepID=A0A2W5N2X4_9BACT|nr:MAG: F0F1 ATP synthase subunit gamma [Micavibrio aeruginosavorus]
MPSLKEYRNSIASVKSTRKITSAMKMVAASKLKKAQDKAESAQPYARAMAEIMDRVSKNVTINATSPKLLAGTGKDNVHLLVVITSDRGLAGGFNANLVRLARQEIRRLHGEDKIVKLVTVGRKARDLLKRDHEDKILKSFVTLGGGKSLNFSDADEVTQYVLALFENGEFDVASVLYNKFVSVLTQKPSAQQIIPFKAEAPANDTSKANKTDVLTGEELSSPYTFEPNEEEMLALLLPKNLGVQMFRALLDSAAGEQAARMTAMDNATRNAGDMIKSLTVRYNRARQAYITKELIEIISGAEAV